MSSKTLRGPCAATIFATSVVVSNVVIIFPCCIGREILADGQVNA